MATKGEETREKLLATAESLILRNGYAGTSLEDVLQATGLTKGAFFHHFRSKAELGRAVVERYAEADFALFEKWSARADRLSADPLERVLIFLRLFEEFLDAQPAPLAGCVFASYTYEAGRFGPDVHDYIRARLRRWQGLYEAKFAALLAVRPPALPVDAATLAETIVTLIEGGFVMANAYRDAGLMQRQSRQFRQYLELLFGASAR